MPTTALITGASSGIGRELARIHAEHGGNLVITARNKVKLDELKAELEEKHGVQVTVIAADLSDPATPNALATAIKADHIEIDYLINNAGFGGRGEFTERSADYDRDMIEVNVQALTKLMHLFLPPMRERNRGKVLNVASTAGFIPGPLQAVYFATKAYVINVTEALAEELRDTGITLTALCPGAVETEFAARADMNGTETFRAPKPVRGVAECGYQAMLAGKTIAFNEVRLGFMLRWIVPLLPRKFVTKMVHKAMEK